MTHSLFTLSGLFGQAGGTGFKFGTPGSGAPAATTGFNLGKLS